MRGAEDGREIDMVKAKIKAFMYSFGDYEDALDLPFTSRSRDLISILQGLDEDKEHALSLLSLSMLYPDP